MGEQNNITQGAREVADLLKEGKTEEVASRLRDDFQNMSSEDFRQFIHKVDQFNAQDRATNANLPDIEFKETEMAGTRAIQQVEITTPGKVFGNWWRNRETVIDTEGGDGMVGHTTSLIHGRNAQLAEAMADANMQRASNENKPIEQRRQ